MQKQDDASTATSRPRLSVSVSDAQVSASVDYAQVSASVEQAQGLSTSASASGGQGSSVWMKQTRKTVNGRTVTTTTICVDGLCRTQTTTH